MFIAVWRFSSSFHNPKNRVHIYFAIYCTQVNGNLRVLTFLVYITVRKCQNSEISVHGCRKSQNSDVSLHQCKEISEFEDFCTLLLGLVGLPEWPPMGYCPGLNQQQQQKHCFTVADSTQPSESISGNWIQNEQQNKKSTPNRPLPSRG